MCTAGHKQLRTIPIKFKIEGFKGKIHEPPPPIAQPKIEYRPIVRQMPFHSSCQNIGSEEERRVCTDTFLNQHIERHLRYPKAAFDSKKEGNVNL